MPSRLVFAKGRGHDHADGPIVGALRLLICSPPAGRAHGAQGGLIAGVVRRVPTSRTARPDGRHLGST